MDVANARCYFEDIPGSPISANIAPVTEAKVGVKIKTKGGLYYTADIGVLSDIDDDYLMLLPGDRIELEAKRKVSWVLGQIDKHGGWWFEKATVWVAKPEIAMIFANVVLVHPGGIITD